MSKKYNYEYEQVETEEENIITKLIKKIFG